MIRAHVEEFRSYLAARKIEREEDVTAALVDEYAAHLRRRPLKRGKGTLQPLTLQGHLLDVKQYFKYLTKKNLILFNPAKDVTVKNAVVALPKNIPNEDEIRFLMKAPDTDAPFGLRDRAVMELLYSTGIRRRELVNLNVYDIDLKEKTLRINDGKGGKDRVVPVGKVACFHVKRYLERVRKKMTRDRSRLALFVGYGGKRLNMTGVYFMIRKYARRVGLPEGIGCHALRHACATHLLKAGARVRMIQELLGHKRIKTTQVYTRLCSTDLKAAHAKYHPRGRIGQAGGQ